jgi:hypothetical protein
MKSHLVVLLVMLFRFHTQAQPTADSLTVAVDSLAVDSFFRIRGIDLTLADNAQIYYEVYSHYGTCYRYGSSGSGSFRL